MDSQVFTMFHVAISVIAIVAGSIVLYGLLASDQMRGMTLLFVVATAATSVTGFFFHRDRILPSHIVGAISLVLLLAAIAALYAYHLRGLWRITYVACAVSCLYLNVFVLIVQAFLKIPPLHVLAPTGSEPPFAIAQGLVLLLFVVFGIRAARRFHPARP